MLPRQFRLTRSSLFPKTLESGVRLCSTPYFLVLGLPRAYESPTPTRFGFIVSRKISNRAVRRNKIRRRLRELVRTFVIPRYYDRTAPYIAVVFIARKGILDAPYSELQKAVGTCFNNI